MTNFGAEQRQQLARQIVSYLLMTLLAALVLGLGLFIFSGLFRNLPGNDNSVLTGAGITLLLVLTANPLWVISQNITRRLLPTASYDPNQVLREYSQSISNILEPERVATAAISLINEALQIQHGILFLVDHEVEEDTSRYCLSFTKGMSGEPLESGELAGNSPIAQYFCTQRQPLLQAEIDHNPGFQSAPAAELAWFIKLSMDVYIPVYTKEDWVGLFALGPKRSGLPYFDEDLTLLSTLAGQTGVALHNARLVESLMRVNNDFRRAYSAMEQANRHLNQVNNLLENLDRTKSDFINIASHELRTPMTVMRGYNEMLLQDPGISANPNHFKMVNGIHSGITRLHEIINSMLDIASIDTRTLQLRLAPVSLSIIIRGICLDFETSFKERNITLEAENLSDLPQVEADADAIHKVFYQLIVNAIKYTPDGGKISIVGLPVSPGQLGLAEGGVEIIISDTGIGIQPEYLELIFTKFYQTGELAYHSSGKVKFKGAGPGLGLAIAKGIVDAHRGKIWAESPGYDEETYPGSQFHVVLPLTSQARI